MEEIIIEVPKEEAHVIALRELDRLKQDKLWQAGKVKTYYARLTDILRAYLANRFNIESIEHTTPEIVADVINLRMLEDEDIEQLESLLDLADLVKFAKKIPDLDDHISSMVQVITFVKKTKHVFKREASLSAQAVTQKETDDV